MTEENTRAQGPNARETGGSGPEDALEALEAQLDEVIERIDGTAEAVVEEHDVTRAGLDARSGEVQAQVADEVEALRADVVDGVERACEDLAQVLGGRLEGVEKSLASLRAELERERSRPPGPPDEDGGRGGHE